MRSKQLVPARSTLGAGLASHVRSDAALVADRFGGPVHCATLMGLQDTISFLFKIPCAFLFGELHGSGYTTQLAIITVALTIAHLCIMIHLILERQPAVTSLPKVRESDALRDALTTLKDDPAPATPEQNAATCCVIS